MGLEFLTNIYFWMGTTFLFLIMFGILFILLIVLAKKTHAIVEFKAWMKGVPIAMFFQENRYVDWKPVKSESGMIDDKHYGSFVINEKATYIDRRTSNVIIPFDANFGVGINMHAAKLADDLQYIMKDEEKMKNLRYAISNNLIDESVKIDVLKTSINVGAIKYMMNAILPHNIEGKIQKIVASRMKSYGSINPMMALIIFGGMLGAIVIGYILIKSVGGA